MPFDDAKLYWGLDHNSQPVVATGKQFKEGGWRLYTRREIAELLGLSLRQLRVERYLYRSVPPDACPACGNELGACCIHNQ